MSLLLDAWIVGSTLRMWATGRPTFGLDAVPRWAWYRWQASPILNFAPPDAAHEHPTPPQVDIDLPVLHEREAIVSAAATFTSIGAEADDWAPVD